nr:uncharacterized protein K02A2.6-like [Lepeophtheirus salmonis]
MSKLIKNTGPIEVFSGGKVKTLGSIRLLVSLNGSDPVVRRFIVSPIGQAILGFHDCLDFGLVKLSNSINAYTAGTSTESRVEILKKKYNIIFDDSKGSTMKQAVIHLQDNARPRYIRARSVPLTLREKVAVEIREMEKRGTISKIDSSEWASPIVSVLKPDGSVRVCADFTQTISPVVNKMLHPLPHPDELFAGLAQGQFFSKLDFSRCYEQYELEEKSKEFLVINTQLGLYRYNVLPYGLASAPTIVQAAQERLLNGIRGVKIYIDDVLIFSRSKEEHFGILNEVFSRISNAGGRLKPGKCILMGEELTYLGFCISQSGRSLDPELIRQVLDFPVPASCTEVKSFLGLVQYYGHFIPHLSEEASPSTN